MQSKAEAISRRRGFSARKKKLPGASKHNETVGCLQFVVDEAHTAGERRNQNKRKIV
jgi:hypothetical protein